ncbi:sorting nexin-4-like [Cimex lectularius]|uniref:PX domain-containing protein n=1 Tax=Cimex lectularius TaxID=79782 RepID=A0A8I6TJC5_CIMLE|nr:sorting nexin-4-like [Cimex lectularius]
MAELCGEGENKKQETDVNLIDCLLNHMEISVSESEKRATSALNIRECYIVYLIKTRITQNGWNLTEHGLGQIWRRYSEFEQLRYYLSNTYPWAVIPPLPEKKHSFPVHTLPTDSFNPDFIDRRRVGLENFLHRVAQHPTISRDPMFLIFLQQEEGWKNSMKDIGYMRLAEEKIKTLNAIVRTKEVDPDFEQIRRYSDGIQGVLSSVLRIRSRAALKRFNIYKWHAGYGKVFSEWSAIEKEMGDGLQQAGHYFDSVASGSESFLEDEELIMDQLKEYLLFASSLGDVCNKRAMLQLEIEKLHDLIKAKTSEKEKITQGKYGMLSRLLGSPEKEDKDRKIAQIDQKIAATQEKIAQSERALDEFKQKALSDFENFKKTKEKDLKDTLEVYIKHEIKMAKKGMQAWKNIQNCIDSISTS